MCALVTGVQTCARPITMNALDLAFTSASIAKAGNSDAAPLTVTVDAAAQTVTFTAPKALAPGKYRLTTDYKGIINTQANGLFATDYPAKAARKRVVWRKSGSVRVDLGGRRIMK